jgi:hypothetical protein
MLRLLDGKEVVGTKDGKNVGTKDEGFIDGLFVIFTFDGEIEDGVTVGEDVGEVLGMAVGLYEGKLLG